MTQEELDALMSGDIEDLESLADDDISDASADEDAGFEEVDEADDENEPVSSKKADDKAAKAKTQWDSLFKS